jgi:PKD repeat protein
MGRYTFDTIGTHRIALEISNKEGKSASYNKEINIDSLLAIKFITSPKIVQVGSPISIIADSKEAQTFEWQFGDGQTDTSTTGRMSHIYKKAGTYSVNITVHGRNSDSNSITRKIYVTDSTNPFAIITLKRDDEEIISTPDVCDGKEAFVTDRAKATTISAENSINTDGTSQ